MQPHRRDEGRKDASRSRSRSNPGDVQDHKDAAEITSVDRGTSSTSSIQAQRAQVVGQYAQTGANLYQMAAMSNALPDFTHSASQGITVSTSPVASRQMMMSPGPNIVYQMPQGYAYSAPSPYAAQQMYPGTYGQAPYIHGYPMPASNAPSGYPVYQAQLGRQTMSPVGHYPQNLGPYNMYPDPMAEHAQRMAMSPTSYNNSRRHESPDQGSSRSQYAVHGSTDSKSRGPDSAAQPKPDSVLGPPRKPRQSGFAIWVGNLPPTATILPLKDHFSQGFSQEIESVFLICKSNCAFVNYRSEDACNRAIRRFHDSRFDGVRLVCRLRKSSVVPSGPAAVLAVAEPRDSDSSSRDKTDSESTSILPKAEIVVSQDAEIAVHNSPKESSKDARTAPIRYFVLKSLTLSDLEQSVRSQVWATQGHNEEVLNEAFKNSENVFLFFSVNKSGEYFGYARMESAIDMDAVQILGPVRRSDVMNPGHHHSVTAAAATKAAPRGRVTDDSFRGTIFWEAEYTDDETAVKEESASKEMPPEQTWGRPFKVEWKSTTAVPFWRTKGIRNPWNANREVKIARDGTEIEPTVGERLICLFHPMET